MIWGARLMSPTGIFAADHGAAPNGRPINRHIIFMTDGDMKPSLLAYSPYGLELIRRRVTPVGTTDSNEQKRLHNIRFQAACTAAKRTNTVWVVSFAQALTPELTSCATSSNTAFQANNATQLNAAFARIASQIADLRLTS
jgi:hypothetical protein